MLFLVCPSQQSILQLNNLEFTFALSAPAGRHIFLKLVSEFLKKYKLHLFFALLIIVELIWIINSDGFYFIDDSTHFNYSRHLFVSYKESIGLWHRLGRVWLFALPAQFGLKGVQLFSAALFCLTIYFAYRILKLKNVRYAEWVILLIGFQPVLFNISFTALAELPAAFLIVLSYYYYLKDKYKSVMIISSLIFLFRMEYFYIPFIFLLIYLYRKKYFSLLLFFTGPIIWFFADWLIRSEYWRFHYDFMYYSNLPKITQGIEWYHYIFYSPVIFGILQCIFFCVTIIVVVFSRHQNPILERSSGSPCSQTPVWEHINKFSDYAILFLFITCGFIVQTLLASKFLNVSSSIGQLRYLAVIGPVFGIIASAGLSSFYGLIKNKYVRSLIMILFALILFTQGPYSVPFHKKLEIEKVSEQIVSLATNSYPGYNILTNLQYIANALDEPVSGGERCNKLTADTLNRYDKALIVWVKELEGSPFVKENISLAQLEGSPDIKLVTCFTNVVNHNYDIPICRFRKEDSEFSRNLFDYLTFDQNCWENFEMKVFLKNHKPPPAADISNK